MLQCGFGTFDRGEEFPTDDHRSQSPLASLLQPSMCCLPPNASEREPHEPRDCPANNRPVSLCPALIIQVEGSMNLCPSTTPPTMRKPKKNRQSYPKLLNSFKQLSISANPKAIEQMDLST